MLNDKHPETRLEITQTPKAYKEQRRNKKTKARWSTTINFKLGEEQRNQKQDWLRKRCSLIIGVENQSYNTVPPWNYQTHTGLTTASTKEAKKGNTYNPSSQRRGTFCNRLLKDRPRLSKSSSDPYQVNRKTRRLQTKGPYNFLTSLLHHWNLNLTTEEEPRGQTRDVTSEESGRPKRTA